MRKVTYFLVLLLCCSVAMSFSRAAASENGYVSGISRYIVSVNSSLSGSARYIAACIVDSSERNGVDPVLLTALISQESRFRPDAVSPAGAIGLGQLMPATAKALGVDDPYDAAQNIEGSAKYLGQMLRKFAGQSTPIVRALAAYNAGPGAVAGYNGVPPYRETDNYVWSIGEKYSAVRAAIEDN